MAEQPQTPVITSVSVNSSSGKVEIKWQIDNPDIVEGYIIKRLIVDGTGVVENTYNTVYTINDNHIFEYTDNSTEFNTTAKPYQRVEYYRVCSFVTVNGKKEYSLMSDPVSTGITKAVYDRCSQLYTISFNKPTGLNIKHFEVYTNDNVSAMQRIALINDTVYSYHFTDFSADRNFMICAITDNNNECYYTSTLCPATDFTAPDTLMINSISVSQNQGLELNVSASYSPDTDRLILLRKTYNVNFDTLSTDFLSGENQIIIDNSADVSQRYFYMLSAENNCYSSMKYSDEKSNIVLSISDSQPNINEISWNNYQFNGEIEKTEIYKSVDGGEFELISTVSAIVPGFSESLSGNIASEEVYEGKFCYKIISYQSNADYKAESNTVCIEKEPLMFFPDALNPEADNKDDCFFKPKGDFVKSYKMKIYNKRGNLLFETNDINVGWDGRSSLGKLYERDTYIYTAEYISSKGKKYKKSGFVNLLY